MSAPRGTHPAVPAVGCVALLVFTIATTNLIPALVVAGGWLLVPWFRRWLTDSAERGLRGVLQLPHVRYGFYLVTGRHITTLPGPARNQIIDADEPATPAAGPTPPAPEPAPAPAAPTTGPPPATPPPTAPVPGVPERPAAPWTADARSNALNGVFLTFHVGAAVTGATHGPTVSRYVVRLNTGVAVRRVTGLLDDITYAMGTPNVRIISPIPGQQAIGIEVPREDPQLVSLDELLAGAPPAHEYPLLVGLGMDVEGRRILADLATMPHLLVGGATNSGKSAGLNAILTSILRRTMASQVRLMLIDPKRVEFQPYAGVAHLVTPVITDPKRAADGLAWAVEEMNQRYDLLAAAGCRNIAEYNKVAWANPTARAPLPYILIVVDELSDLMMVAPSDVEAAIVRLTQLARAAGIHLVLATQRPSVDVVTGLIKANIPGRLSYAVASAADSRVILDKGGAEKLLGRGDGLFLHPGSSGPARIQGTWVSDDEIRAVAAASQPPGSSGRQYLIDDLPARPEQPDGRPVPAPVDEDAELLQLAVDLVVSSQFASTAMLQRKLRIGHRKASQLMERMEALGIVSAADGTRAREVLRKPDDIANPA